MPNSINASWTFDTRPQAPGGAQGKYAFAQKYVDYQHWSVTAASYGSQGSADLLTDLNSGPYADVLTQARRAKVIASLKLNTGAVTQVSDYLFTGYVDKLDVNFDNNDLSIYMRDSSAALMESTVKSRSFQNTPVAQLISQLTLAVNLQPDIIANVDHNAGYYFNARSGMAEHRSSAWDLIQRLATETENVAFCTPAGLFYFGPRERPNVLPLRLKWSYDDHTNDFIQLSCSCEPLRNSVFFVIVQGHTPHNGANVVGTAAYVNDAIAADIGKPAGIYEGMSLAAANALFGEDNLQVYNFNAEGLTGNGVQSIATSHALDIQGHEFVLKATVLGSARYRIADPVIITGTRQAAIDNRRFTIVGIEHSLDIGTGDTSQGFVTHLTLWASGAKVVTAQGVKKVRPAPAPVPKAAKLQPPPDAPPTDPYAICKDYNADNTAKPVDPFAYRPIDYVTRDD